VRQKEFGVKGPEVTIIRQGSWYIERGRSATAALGVKPRSRTSIYEDTP
jgi:hypothetical protein